MSAVLATVLMTLTTRMKEGGLVSLYDILFVARKVPAIVFTTV